MYFQPTKEILGFSSLEFEKGGWKTNASAVNFILKLNDDLIPFLGFDIRNTFRVHIFSVSNF